MALFGRRKTDGPGPLARLGAGINTLTRGFIKGVALIALVAVAGTAIVGAVAAAGWGVPLTEHIGGGMFRPAGVGGFSTGLAAGAQTGLAALFSGKPGLALMGVFGAAGSYMAWNGRKREGAIQTMVSQNVELQRALAAEYARAPGQMIVEKPAPEPEVQYVNAPPSNPYPARDPMVKTLLAQNKELQHALANEYAKAPPPAANLNGADLLAAANTAPYVDPLTDPYFNNHPACGCKKSFVATEDQRRLANLENPSILGNLYG